MKLPSNWGGTGAIAYYIRYIGLDSLLSARRRLPPLVYLRAVRCALLAAGENCASRAESRTPRHDRLENRFVKRPIGRIAAAGAQFRGKGQQFV